ncbi:abscisic acid receptor pyl6, partial [Phtheirospermum japonicum]
TPTPSGPTSAAPPPRKQISAPVSTVWSVVRRFDNPQAYKHFVKKLPRHPRRRRRGDPAGGPGHLRPASCQQHREAWRSWTTRRHVTSFSVIGGDHRLANYRSVTTLHAAESGGGTVVVESYVVDVPQGNTKEETCVFVDTIVNCNLQSLARIAQNLGRRNTASSKI